MIADVLRAGDKNSAPEDLIRLLERFDDVELVVTELGRMIASQQSVQALVERSYLHANGFLKITLVQLSQFAPRLRLHKWMPSDAGAEMTIHNHAWSYASMVVSGSFNMNTYDLDSSGREYHASAVGTLAKPGIDDLGLARLSDGARVTFVSGSRYGCSDTVLHRFDQIKSGTMTLVLQGAHAKTSSKTFDVGSFGTTPYAPVRPSPSEVVLAVEELIAALRQAPRSRSISVWL